LKPNPDRGYHVVGESDLQIQTFKRRGLRQANVGNDRRDFSYLALCG